MAIQLPKTPEIELRQRDLSYLLPGGLIALASLVAFHKYGDTPEVKGFLVYYPYLVLVAGLFLGWRFNRTRLIFALLALTLANQIISLAVYEPDRSVAIDAAQFLIPLNLAMISFFVERGIINRPGLLRAGVICAQPALLAMFYQDNPAALEHFLSQELIPWSALSHLPLHQIPFAALLLGGGVLLVRFLWQPSAIDAGFLWALATTIIPLAIPGMEPQTLTCWFATAGLILTVSLIESSHRMAYRDELTGLYTRRALNENLLKIGRTYTIAMVDIDHFKKVNDTYGHDVGDQVLKMVASHIEEVTGGGKPFRFGGEEFTVLFPNKTLREALPHLEDLRMAIEASGFMLRSPQRPPEKPEAAAKADAGSEKLRVTVSIGVAEYNTFNLTAAQVIKAADKALYKAKEGGRNRVCRAGAR